MIKYFILLITLSFLFNEVIGQSVESSFTINGTINSDNGKMILLPIVDSSYYPMKVGFMESEVVKGKFTFNAPISYPYAFQLGMKTNSEWKYISDIFFIEPGEQSLLCNVDSSREIPNIINRSMKELKSNYNNSANSSVAERDKILLAYTIKHPNSYIALWKLIKGFSNGYEKIYDTIYAHFSDSIKRTFTGLALARKLKNSKTAGVGQYFPEIRLWDINNMNTTLKIKNSYKFTLIDFWFSHCSPCIAQFNQLKSMYEKYMTRGFHLIGISTDTKEYVNSWKKVIKKYSLPWKQYLDLNGKEANKLSIKAFPTNFLIDKDGKVIAKDIELSELNALLLRSLK